FKEEHTLRPQFFSSLFRKLSNSDASFLELSISLDEDVLKSTLWECVKCFEASGSFSKGCNPSFIVLIPKKSNPFGFSDNRPMAHLKDCKLLLFKGDFEKAFDNVNWNFSLMS
ncbi:hypothetical protein Tco_0778821, partial [Tanacetum coccineum]